MDIAGTVVEPRNAHTLASPNDLCDENSKTKSVDAPSSRWPPAMRRFPRSDSWKAQKVLRMFRNGKALDGAGTGSSQGMPFPERCCERTQRRSRGCAIVTWKAVTATNFRSTSDSSTSSSGPQRILTRSCEPRCTRCEGRTVYEDAEISHVVSPQEKVGRTGNKRKRNSRSSHGGENYASCTRPTGDFLVVKSPRFRQFT